VSEDTDPNPSTPYATAKLEAEMTLGNRSTVMRVSTVYGPASWCRAQSLHSSKPVSVGARRCCMRVDATSRTTCRSKRSPKLLLRRHKRQGTGIESSTSARGSAVVLQLCSMPLQECLAPCPRSTTSRARAHQQDSWYRHSGQGLNSASTLAPTSMPGSGRKLPGSMRTGRSGSRSYPIRQIQPLPNAPRREPCAKSGHSFESHTFV
jgi:hypothetical protein